MLLLLIFTSLLVLILLLINSCWIRPKRALKFYQNQLKNMKYKSLVMPYKLLYNRFLAPHLQGKKIGDPAFYYKTEFPKYDLVVSNVMNTPYIEFGHIDFFKDYYSMDKHYEYPKLPMFIDPMIRLVGQAIGFSEGPIWKKKRAILNKIFTFDFVKMQIPNIVDICDRCIRQMEEKAKKGQDQSGCYVQCYILNDLLSNIFSSVIFTGFLGLKQKYYIDGVQVSQYLLKLIDDIGQYRFLSPTIILGKRFYDLEIRKIDKSINDRSKKLKEWGYRIMNEQLAKINSQIEKNGKQIAIDSILKAFVLEKIQNNLSDDIISNKDIFAEFIGFIFAGTDTTSNYLNGMLCYIAKNPEVQKQLRKQIDEYLKDDNYSFENLKNFRYIQAIQKETTRIYGPVNILFLRQAAVDNYLNGVAIKKGTMVSVNCYTNYFSEKYFKQPLKFRPQRWLNGECENLDPFILMGFSGGARTCIGKHLAMLESKIALIKIMKRYKKISLGLQNFKWTKKLFNLPEYFETKLTINDQS